jgi:hypothetical protein
VSNIINPYVRIMLTAVLQIANDEERPEALGGGTSHSDAVNLVDEPNLPDHVAFR